jgi:leucine dehydrogenase
MRAGCERGPRSPVGPLTIACLPSFSSAAVSVFEAEEFQGHEEVTYFSDLSARLRAIVAIHNTALGPALGGCRLLPYGSSNEALGDVLRLSRAMTHKAACAGVPFGGGKCVVIADPQRDKDAKLLKALGRCIVRFEGRFFLGEDVGTSVEDMAVIHEEAPNVVGLPIGLGGSGDPSVWTTKGCMVGMRAAVKEALGIESLSGLRVAVQGLGNVGWRMCQELANENASLIVADIRPKVAADAGRIFGATVVPPQAIYDADADVFAPCALGGILNEATVDRLAVAIIAGSANNQLLHPGIGQALHARNILYAPDYVINAGGMIRLAGEIHDWSDHRLHETIASIADTLRTIFERSRSLNIPTGEAADGVAEHRLQVSSSPSVSHTIQNGASS